MFDIGFSELLLIALIGIVVIGPKRLPETLRFVGLWVGRLKRAMSRTFKELEREVGIDDVRRQLHNEDVMRKLAEQEKAQASTPNPPDITTDQPAENHDKS